MGDRTEKIEQLQKQLADQVAALVSGEDWVRMLATAARFHRYSFGNVMLIMRQCPDATKVAGFQTWKDLGRHVRKGEKAIRILAPCRCKVQDKETGEDKWVVRGFTTACVFDISQTFGDEIDDVRAEIVEGEAPQDLYDVVCKGIAEAGFMLERCMSAADIRGANGVTDYMTRTVTVRADMPDAQVGKTLVHELAHILLGHESELGGGCRGRLEIEAESVAFVVCSALGMSTDGYSIPYVGIWSGGDVAKVKETAEKVVRVAGQILAGLEGA